RPDLCGQPQRPLRPQEARQRRHQVAQGHAPVVAQERPRADDARRWRLRRNQGPRRSHLHLRRQPGAAGQAARRQLPGGDRSLPRSRGPRSRARAAAMERQGRAARLRQGPGRNRDRDGLGQALIRPTTSVKEIDMNKFCKSSLLSLLIAAAALPSAALAHRTFLIASSGHVDGKEPWVTFDAAVGEDLFDFGANAVKLDGLSITGPDGKSLSPENPFTGKLRSSFDLKLAQEGTYRVAIVNESVMGSYKIGNETKRVRGGTAESFAKEVPAGATEVRTTTTVGRLETFVTSGKGNDTVFKPTNVGLEILPLTHPSDFLPGQPARFKLLLDGKPLAD